MKMESVLRCVCVCVFGILQEMPEIYVCVIGVTFSASDSTATDRVAAGDEPPFSSHFPSFSSGPCYVGGVSKCFQCAHLTAAL